jgi:predicted transcriptional regulator
MEIEFLTKFGMTPTEAQVYLDILKSREIQIGPIIKNTGLHRGTIYNTINNLIKKGFVGFINKSGIRYYNACKKNRFDNIIDDKKRELDEDKKNVESLLKDMSKLCQNNCEQEVNVLQGVEAFKTAFLEIYDYCKENGCEYLFQGRGGEMQDATGEEFYKYTQKLKKKMKISCRVILDFENIGHSYHKHVAGNIKHLPSKVFSPVNFWIYGDIVLIVLFRASPLTTIKIRSNYLADSFRNYFEYLWKISNK